ncbi:MAG: isocitrate/isopropylmalate family dehydrogenase [Microcystis sp.]|jgi:isocitrate/isopropylmalate dehydrogenase|uniref:Isocitrate dehydrogenase n=1 Tax=Microcystis aeruginosa Ma_QC_Ca_00000000_S207 TaxID=2486251 RepID=A0A552FT99_MICAE|nr:MULTISPECIES: isocitrate/isopropylmalate family dehydrogenase [unclassified Microcystis]MCU7242762.1 isocitrate/isopropylmalate family dehydrogenase [Microcystis aeruginosa WS75]NCQ69931.1 isocitrate dehydrogenase [Microcystis aeruginosa W13-16]NCQ74454.1 isocitrate dehydrogenase [Microcystis aeruginosa W13-13]NCQ78936.1 isocitrate dehydrogenase [Microcystis aeruginosa W13-15]NCQ85079.1 isocitrate dehydrogenase [Microcystis aeruginosa W13-18]NCR22659.1 isocitrate dehydrogenase [Microcystis
MTENIPTIVVMHGDQTGEELLLEALRVLQPSIIRQPLNFADFDLSLAQRRQSNNQVVYEAAEATLKTGLALKAATITPEIKGDVGSPNAILREAMNSQVILRIGRRIPGIRPIGGVYSPIAIVRMAVDDAYGAKEWRETTATSDEIAYRTSRISRATSRAVAEFTFQHAKKTGARVFGGPKFTVSATYEGMFKEELDAAAQRHPEVRYQPLLIDATFALLLQTDGEALVIPALNRDGDLLSDFVLQLYGSIAGAESLVLGFDEETLAVKTIMAEAPHGTAPALEGKNIANPMAMILASAALLGYIETSEARKASRAIYESVFETIHEGKKTPDLGGQMTMSEFTDEVIRRVVSKLEVWSALG